MIWIPKVLKIRGFKLKDPWNGYTQHFGIIPHWNPIIYWNNPIKLPRMKNDHHSQKHSTKWVKNDMNPKSIEITWVQAQVSLEWIHTTFWNKTSLKPNDLMKLRHKITQNEKWPPFTETYHKMGEKWYES